MMRMYSVRFGFSYLKDRKAILWLCVTIFYFQKKKRKRTEKRKIIPICSSLGTQT